MPVAWSTAAPLNRLLTILQGLSGLQSAQIGVPESFDRRVTAYVTVAAQDIDNKSTGGQMQRIQAYRVAFCFALDGAEASAEAAIADLLDAFMDAIFTDRTLGSTLERVEVNATEADDPVYVRVSGEEIRQYVLYVRGSQRKTYSV